MIDAGFTLAIRILFGILPVAAVVLLGVVTFKLWVHYVQQKFLTGIEWVLLEIVPPREVLRSPMGMELFFTNALYQWTDKGPGERYLQGATQFFYSLEIASIEGQVHFYIRAPSRNKALIETQLYAQYPQAQVKEVPDYSLAVDEISPTSAWNGWGCEFKLLKPEAFPIRTYVDFGLDKDPKEEFKVDPIAPVIELFGSIGKGEQMWLQIVVKASKKKYHTHGTWFGKHDWVEQSKVELHKLLDPYTREFEVLPGHTPTKAVYVPAYLTGTVERMGKKTNKLGFDCGVRVMYVAKKEAFHNNGRRNIRLIFRQYANPDANQFWRINSTQGDVYKWSEALVSTAKVMTYKNRHLHEYQERSFFYHPLRHHIFSNTFLKWPIQPFIFAGYPHPSTFVLNAEELATIWHFPGQILKVPTLTRIESKEASPPPNLPT